MHPYQADHNLFHLTFSNIPTNRDQLISFQNMFDKKVHMYHIDRVCIFFTKWLNLIQNRFYNATG